MYAVEAFSDAHGWMRVVVDTDKAYCQGFLDGRKSCPAPRLALRLISLKSGNVLDEVEEREDVSVDAAIGFPTAAQYRQAAEDALATAERLEQQERAENGTRTFL